MKTLKRFFGTILIILLAGVLVSGCSSEKEKNQAKEAAARYWQDKAYPGKAYDVQVIEAEKTDGGYRIKGIVDGETRVGVYNPDTDTFNEGYYSLAKERDKRIAELEQEVKYWKDRSENQDKEIYKLKVRLDLASGKKLDSDSQDEDDVTNVSGTVTKPGDSPATAPAKPTAQ